mmetsp:Transcript_12640/g.22887  ORF Transcript_12640/g.22887 Transcript_12640/m.22887 type:complete len:212 (-) Transcript_12640:351-986(-)
MLAIMISSNIWRLTMSMVLFMMSIATLVNANFNDNNTPSVTELFPPSPAVISERELKPSFSRPSLSSPSTPSRPSVYRPSSNVCTRNGICGFGETCRNCLFDCTRHSSTCGDGICVEGENCVTCPQDCNGNLNTTNITETEKYCCGWDDLYAPDGCGDSRCSSGTKTCITYACEGLNRRSQSAASNVSYSWTTMALSIASTGIAFALFNIL